MPEILQSSSLSGDAVHAAALGRSVAERRAAIVKEALEWIGTPYVPRGRVKGKNGGVDCLTFLAGVFENVGEIDPLPIPNYPHDFHLHSEIPYYLEGKDGTPGLLDFCYEIQGLPLPGDIALYWFGLQYSHSAIVLEWPLIIHAWFKKPVGRDDANRRTVLNTIHEQIDKRGQPRPRKFFRLKGWKE